MKASIIGTGFGSSVCARLYRDAGIGVDIIASPRDPEAVKRACAAPVDFVSIHSPPFLHREHVMLALENGRNVLCDKPFGRSAAEARDMLNAATAAGVIHLLNFEFRQDEGRVQMKRLIEEGAIGTPRHLNWTMFSTGSRIPLRPYGWLFDQARGGGWVGAYGSHIIDFLRWIIGEIDQATGVLRTDIKSRPDRDGVEHVCTADDAFSASFTFRNGATANIDTAFAAPVGRPQQIEIFGSEGLLVYSGTTEVALYRPGEAPRTFAYEPFAGDPHEPSFRPWAKIVHDTMRDRRQIEPSFADGLACAEVMDKLRASALAGG